MATLVSSLSPLHLSTQLHRKSSFLLKPNSFLSQNQNFNLLNCRGLTVVAATEGSAKSRPGEEKNGEEDSSVPSWAQPGSDEAPPWARDEAQKDSSTFEVPFYVYLLASAITAIAAVGSVFEYVNQKPVFGVLGSDSVFYTPLLGFFAFTGVPTSAFLWFKSVEAANKEAEEQDRRDGFL